MAQGQGIQFSIGAFLSKTASTAFATLGDRIKGTGTLLSQTQKQAQVLNRALELKSARESLGRQVTAARAAGESTSKLLKELHKVNTEYRAVTATVKGFGLSMNGAAQAQALAATRSELLSRKLRELNTLSAANAERMQLMGRAMTTFMGAVAVASPIKKAMELEETMAATATAFSGARDALGKLTDKYYEMEGAIKTLSTELGVGADKLAQLTANAGDDGVTSVTDLEKRLRAVSQTAAAYGMSLEDADTYYRNLSKSMGMTADEVAKQLDLYNALSGANGVAESPIMKIVDQLAQESKAAHVGADTMAALAATLSGLRVDSSQAEGGMRKLLQVMSVGENATKAQREAFASLGIDITKMSEYMEQDSSAAILTLLGSLEKLGPAARTAKLQEIFGPKQAASILPLIENLDKVRQNLNLAGDATQYTGNLQNKYSSVTDNAAYSWRKVTATAQVAVMNIGQVVLPVLKDVFEFLANFTKKVAAFAQEHQTLVKVLLGAAAAFVGIKIAALGFSAAMAAGRTAMAAYTVVVTTVKAAMLTWSVASKAAAAAQIALNVAMSANPIGLIIAGVAALTAGFVYLWKNCETFRNICTTVFDVVTFPIRTVIGLVEALFGRFTALSSVAETIRSAFGSAFSFISDAIGKVAGPLKKMFSWFGGDDKTPAENAAELAETTTDASPDARIASQPSLPVTPLPEFTPPAESLPARPESASASPVSVRMNFEIKGMPAETLANGVMQALQSRQSDFERLVNECISAGERGSYGY